MLICSNSKIFFLKLNQNLNDLDFTFDELSDKSNILRKFINSFVPAKETSKVFVLNPFNYSKFSRNNKKNNTIFILNENYLKKLEFNVTFKGIEAEVNCLNLKFS